jgi:outer membrane protein assembly factor BamD (BamD/ComL family)
VQQEFQQLGSDLQSGNLSAAQTDFSTLQSLVPQSSFASKVLQGDNPIGDAFSQLAQDLKSGNISGARQDFASLQKDFQKLPHHGHGVRAGSGGSDPINQLFDQLGSALQSGDLSTAQQAVASLTQQLSQDFSTQNATSLTSPSANVSVSV